MKKWTQIGSYYYYNEERQYNNLLEPAIYSVLEDQDGVLTLSREKSNFSFDHKIYGLRQSIVSRLKKVFDNKTQVGCLLNGLKGTGKSVTSKIICNNLIDLGYPVILVNKNYKGICEFLSSINENLIIFVDEFEKVFEEDGYGSEPSALLSMLDGALTSDCKRLYLMTSNNTDINTNLLSRPGRIRYIFNFEDLTRVQVEEIVDDLLDSDKTTFREDIIDFISKAELISIDAVKTIVQEVNLFNESPLLFKEFINVIEKDVKFNFYNEDNELVFENVITSPPDLLGFKPNSYGSSFFINEGHEGYIYKVIGSVIHYKEDRNDEDFKKLKVIKVRPTHKNFVL